MRVKAELRPYQDRFAEFLYERDAALAIGRPGAGKTAAALTAIAELLDDKVIRHALVVAPKRVARNVWPDEIAAWAHTCGLRYAVLDGPPASRAALLGAAHTRDVTIIGIDNIQWLVDQLRNRAPDDPVFDLLVIDEISKLRAPTSKRSAALAGMARRWTMIWGLSGTLRPSSAQDLFGPARVVTRGRLWGRSFYAWRQRNFYATDYNKYHWVPLPGTEDRLNAELAPVVVTLAAGEMPQMPELSVVLDRVDLPPHARADYRTMERSLLVRGADDDIIAASSGVATGKLAQIANGFIYDQAGGVTFEHTEKRDWLRGLIDDAAGPALLVYEFITDLNIMRSLLGNDLPFLGQGVSALTADETIKRWNAGELPFLALHPAAGGHGLNLQTGGADMWWFSPTWSPELWEQTIARLHRPGQTKPVMVRVCVANATVDDMKLDRVHCKMSAQQAFEAYLRRAQVFAEAAE